MILEYREVQRNRGASSTRIQLLLSLKSSRMGECISIDEFVTQIVNDNLLRLAISSVTLPSVNRVCQSRDLPERQSRKLLLIQSRWRRWCTFLTSQASLRAWSGRFRWWGCFWYLWRYQQRQQWSQQRRRSGCRRWRNRKQYNGRVWS